jgi:signal transduction histidine kinase
LKFTFKGYVEAKVSLKENFLVTEVDDTGIGMKSEDLNKLFCFFGKLQNTNNINKGGMGLGLTISKMII